VAYDQSENMTCKGSMKDTSVCLQMEETNLLIRNKLQRDSWKITCDATNITENPIFASLLTLVQGRSVQTVFLLLYMSSGVASPKI